MAGVLGTVAAPAHADSEPAIATRLHPHAALIVRADPQQVTAVARLCRRLARVSARRHKDAALPCRLADQIDRWAWSLRPGLGINGRAPIWASLALAAETSAAPPPGIGAPEQPSGAQNGPLVHVRALVSIANRGRTTGLLRRVVAWIPGAVFVDRAHESRLAALLGAPAASKKAVREALLHHGVFVAARVPRGRSLVLLRADTTSMTLDFFTAPSRGSWTWDGNLPRALALIRHTDAAGELGERLQRGAAQRLAQPGLVVWGDALRLGELLAQLAAVKPGQQRPDGCDELLELAARGPLYDVAAAAHLEPARLTASLRWGVRSSAFLRQRFLSEDDDALLDPQRPLPGGAVLSATLSMRSLAPLRALPRPESMNGSVHAVAHRASRCGLDVAISTLLFTWPHLVGMTLDAIADLHPEAVTLTSGARYAAVAIRHLTTSPQTLRGVVEVSMTPAAARISERYLDLLFGRRAALRGFGRPVTVWGRGRIRPYRRDHAGVAVLGAGIHPESVRWRLTHLTPATITRGKSETLGILCADASRILPGIGLTPRRRDGRSAGSTVGLTRGYVRLRGDELEANVEVEMSEP